MKIIKNMLFTFMLLLIMIPLVNAEEDYSWVKNLLVANNYYDEENETIIVLDYDIKLSKFGIEQGIALEDIHRWSFSYSATTNDNEHPILYQYFVNNESNTVTRNNISQDRDFPISSGGTDNDRTVLVVPNNKQVTIKVEKYDWMYTNRGYYIYPTSQNVYDGITLNTSGGILRTNFEYEVHKSFDLDMEFYTVDTKTRIGDNPGFMGAKGNIKLKIELRDKNGNIYPLPKQSVPIYGYDTYLADMKEDGIIEFCIDTDEVENGCTYGEVDFGIPQGYEYRISVLEATGTLGQFAYYYDYNPRKEDGFVDISTQTDKDITFIEMTFFRQTEKITIKNIDNNNNASDTFYYQIKQPIITTYTGSHNWDDTHPGILLEMNLANYEYHIFDEKTNEEIEPNIIHKTDENGMFSLKNNQYAVFSVFKIPEDLAEYDGNWFDPTDISYEPSNLEPKPYKIYVTDREKYYRVYNNETEFHDNVSTAILGETVVYELKKLTPPAASEEKPNPETSSGNIIILLLIAIATSIYVISSNNKPIKTREI